MHKEHCAEGGKNLIEAKVNWIANMQFVGKADSGHAVVMDTRAEMGGDNSASTPMELLLIALGGCTGMDIVSILRKMEVEFDSIEIGTKGERVEEHPRVYEKIWLMYKIKGKTISQDKVKRAIELSQEKYCSLLAMLKPKVEIDYIVEIK